MKRIAADPEVQLQYTELSASRRARPYVRDCQRHGGVDRCASAREAL